jgi:transposase
VKNVSIIGLDLAKNVFQAHGADASGAVIFRKKLRRAQVLELFAAQPPCTVAMEACGGSHFWGREIGKFGHRVRLIPPAYVKPFGAPRRRVSPVEEGSTQIVVDWSGS